MKKTLFLVFLFIPFLNNAQIREGELYDACESGDFDIVKKYIKEDQNINIDFEKGKITEVWKGQDNN